MGFIIAIIQKLQFTKSNYDHCDKLLVYQVSSCLKITGDVLKRSLSLIYPVGGNNWPLRFQLQ